MRSRYIYQIAITSLLLYSCTEPNDINESLNIKVDSVSYWIKKSKDKSFTNKDQLTFLDKAFIKINSRKEDSIDPQQLSSIAFRYYELNDTLSFLKLNEETLNLAIKRKDSFIIADAHWSYGAYYIDNESHEKAYYHYNYAYNFFNRLNKKYETARMLYSMAFIKGRYRDYTGSEVLLFEAIKKFQELNKFNQLFYSYNLLGLLQIDIKDYDKALKFFEEASIYLEKIDDKKNFHSWNLNNIGLVHQLKNDHQKAIEYFDEALLKNKKEDIKNYAIIIDNKSFSKLKLKDTLGIKSTFLKALKIRDSINDKAGIISSKLRISEFYKYNRDITKAIKYAKEANILAEEIKNGNDYLSSLKLLGDLQPKMAKEYLDKYAHFSDSLINSERNTINKFTRIEFETDEYIEETIRLSEETKRLTQQRLWIFASSTGVILILSLLYLVRVQRAKNEKLFLETEQQKANEQVYLLTLKQQATLEEEKTRERNRISQELHDGILGRLFGTRVGMGFLDINADEETQQQHQAFLNELQEIEKEIREVSHKLNDNFEDSDVNFTTIINQLLESKSQIGDFRFHLDIDQNISWKSTDEIIKVNVYRIIQEALQNTIKHAEAKNVSLDFSSDSNQLSIRLKDDGKGFSMKKSKKGIGLKNIRSRVEKMNGTVNIVSAIGKGTEIHIKIPISQ